jgi:hypothetical protein
MISLGGAAMQSVLILLFPLLVPIGEVLKLKAA